MSLRRRLARAYFDAVYNPLYDASTARLARYQQAQGRLAELLYVMPGQRILCAGLGTGNEMTRLRQRETPLNIAGIDLSPAAIRRARRKSSHATSTTWFALMDLQSLAFRDGCFERVLCYHVLDFVEDPTAVVRELLRVLTPGGRFVISFPSGNEDAAFGAGLLRHSVSASGQSQTRISRLARAALAGCIYVPLMLRHRPPAYSTVDVQRQLGSLGAEEVIIETDAVYRDHIASGMKKTKEGISRAT